jgi:predicted dehydrogenase
MLRDAAPLDLVCVATTAPSHVQLGRLALRAGVRRILLEKPMDAALLDARAFDTECRAAGVKLSVNYSRRWMPDYQAIQRCIGRGMIGRPRSICVMVGKGELAMHASHYFDLCRHLLGSEPEAILGQFDATTEVNARGAEYEDPSGHCVVRFRCGSRAYVDFSSDMEAKDPFVVVKGTTGRITIDERRGEWSMQSRSQRIWQFPFAEPMSAAGSVARVVADVLSSSLEEAAPCSGADGVAALEMILGAHVSHREGGRWVALPLPPAQAGLVMRFP